MANLPDDVYSFIQGMMHTSPPEAWSPVVHHKLGDDIDLYNLAEGCYDMDPNFPFVPADQESIPRDSLTSKAHHGQLIKSMRFGLCLVKLPNGTNVLLDAGLGPWLPDVQKCSGHPVPCAPPHPLTSLLSRLDDLTLEDIHFVVHSHCHGDHVGWVGHFPHAIHCVHAREYEFATYSGCPWRQDAIQRFEPLQTEGRLRLLQADDDDEAAIVLDEKRAPQISILLAEGHTPGHVCVEITSGDDDDKSALYVGDALHFAFQVENPKLVPLFDCCAWKVRPFLPFGGDEQTKTTWMPWMRSNETRKNWNESTSVHSRKRILQRIADKKALLVSPHLAPPGLGRVIDKGDGHFRFESL